MKILVSRTDRAGDLILTLPVFAALRLGFPGATIVGHVRGYTAPLLGENPDSDGVLVDDPGGRNLPVLVLARRLRSMGFTHAVIVHPTFRILAASWLAGIPVRAGRASNVWQFLLTERMVQNRSRNDKHESEYNLDLVRGLHIPVPSLLPRVKPTGEALRWGRALLDSIGFQGVSPVIVHPGHGGSSRNLPPRRYAELADRLKGAGIPIAVSLGPGEGVLRSWFEVLGNGPVPVLDSIPDLGKMAGVLAHARGFAGGSTGPMHLAAALGIPTVAFFPKDQGSMTPKRWGPRGGDCLVLQPPDVPGSDMEHIPLERAITWIGKTC